MRKRTLSRRRKPIATSLCRARFLAVQTLSTGPARADSEFRSLTGQTHNDCMRLTDSETLLV
jgi:hypothetical protein